MRKGFLAGVVGLALPAALLLISLLSGRSHSSPVVDPFGGWEPGCNPAHVRWTANRIRTAPKYTSVLGRPIETFEFGAGPDTVLVIAGVHGDEIGGIVLARELIHRLRMLPESAFLSKIVVTPLLNPDGYAAHKRVNAHGIDLNRNLPSKDFDGKTPSTSSRYGGRTAGSEPETQAVMGIIDFYRPQIIISLHTPLGRVIYSGPSQEEAELVSRLTGFPAGRDIGYPMPGSMDTYFGRDRGCKWMTIEVESGAQQWDRCGKALLAVLGVAGSETQWSLPQGRLAVGSSH